MQLTKLKYITGKFPLILLNYLCEQVFTYINRKQELKWLKQVSYFYSQIIFTHNYTCWQKKLNSTHLINIRFLKQPTGGRKGTRVCLNRWAISFKSEGLTLLQESSIYQVGRLWRPVNEEVNVLFSSWSGLFRQGHFIFSTCFAMALKRWVVVSDWVKQKLWGDRE